MNYRKFIKYLILIVLALLIILALRWLWSAGRIVVNLPASGLKTIQVIGSSSSSTYQTESDRYSLTTKPGFYSVIIKSEDGSYVELINVNNFYRSTTVNVDALSKQQGRQFIGDEPRLCRHVLLDKSLVSYPCGGGVSSMVYHRPASDSLPTYAQKNIFPDTRELKLIEGVFTLNNSDYALIKSTYLDGVAHELYSLKVISGNMTAVFEKELPELQDNQYEVENTQIGVRLTSGTNVLEGKDLDNLTTYRIEATENYNESSDVDFYRSNVEVLTTNYIDELENNKIKTEVVVSDFEGNNIKSFSENYAEFIYCGDYICSMNDNRLTVFSQELKVLYEVYDVIGFRVNQNRERLYAYSDTTVFDINPNTRKGSIIFENSSVKVTDMSLEGKNILVVGEIKNKQYAMLLDYEKQNKPDIDIQPLADNSFVEALSVYGKYVYISPNIGEMEVDPTTGKLEYREDLKSAARQSINNVITESNLIGKGYIVKVNLL